MRPPKTEVFEIFKKFEFSSAHQLCDLPEGHKCRRVHGHNYKMTVRLRGPLERREGWVCDFGEVGRIVKEAILDVVDHRFLNQLDGIEGDTTCECLCYWAFQTLGPYFGPLLHSIEITENDNIGAVYPCR